MHLSHHSSEIERVLAHDSAGDGQNGIDPDFEDFSPNGFGQPHVSWRSTSVDSSSPSMDDDDEIGDIARHFGDD